MTTPDFDHSPWSWLVETLLRRTSAVLANLLATPLYETWDDDARDTADQLLRELAHQAQALRPRLVAGIPDPPAGTETWARAGELLEGVPEPDRAIRLLAATVQAFEDAGLSDGSHFIAMCEHVWGIEPLNENADVLEREYALRTLREELQIGHPAAAAVLTQASDEAFGWSWSAEFNPPRQGRSLSFRKLTVHAVRNVPHSDDVTGFRIRYYT